MQIIFLGLIGLCAGVFVASGLCAVLTSVNVIVRISHKTKTQDRIRLYENCILLSAVFFTFVYLLEPDLQLHAILAEIVYAVLGLFFGIFVGCLAVSLAEALDASTISFRRIKLTKNTKYILWALALGKFAGNLIYFLFQ